MCCERALIYPILTVYVDVPNIASVSWVLIHAVVMKYLSETKIQQEMWMGKTHGRGVKNKKTVEDF
jgi:hypothetical protein